MNVEIFIFMMEKKFEKKIHLILSLLLCSERQTN